MNLFSLLIILTSIHCFALTEQQVVNSVLTHFPLIQEAEMKSLSTEGELTSAQGAFDYKLLFKSRNRIEDRFDNQYFETTIERQTTLGGTSLVAGHRQGRGTFPAYDGKFKTSGAGEIFAGLSVPILRNFKTDEFRTNLKIKQIENKQALEELKLKKIIYIHKALSIYYKWVLESQKLKINRGIYELAKLRHSMIERRFKAGDLEQIKVADNLRAIEKRKDEVVKNQIELNKVKTLLALYARDKDGTPLQLTEESSSELILKHPEGSIPKNISISENPQLEIIQLEKQRLISELEYFDQSQKPGLNLELLGARELSPNAAYDPQSLQVGVKFDFPLENRKAEGKTVAYFYKVKALEKQKIYLEQELLQQFNFFKDASDQSKQRWEITSREYESTQRMAEAEKSKWNQGASDLFIVNLREQDVADVEIRRWSALYEYHQYMIDAKLFSATLPTKNINSK